MVSKCPHVPPQIKPCLSKPTKIGQSECNEIGCSDDQERELREIGGHMGRDVVKVYKVTASPAPKADAISTEMVLRTDTLPRGVNYCRVAISNTLKQDRIGGCRFGPWCRNPRQGRSTGRSPGLLRRGLGLDRRRRYPEPDMGLRRIG
jgi:hypothetical protein